MKENSNLITSHSRNHLIFISLEYSITCDKEDDGDTIQNNKFNIITWYDEWGKNDKHIGINHCCFFSHKTCNSSCVIIIVDSIGYVYILLFIMIFNTGKHAFIIDCIESINSSFFSFTFCVIKDKNDWMNGEEFVCTTMN